ncbi:MAG: NAD-dependent epimerase/dehydratase family protein [Thermoplasmata archaeon]
MKKILITGGAGFIGSSLVNELKKRKNYDVYVLDVKKDPENLKNVIQKITYIYGDIRDRKLLNGLFLQHHFDGIIHLAAVSRVIWGEEDPEMCISTNIGGTKNLVEIVSETQRNMPWIIFGSSREVYGEPLTLPVSEDDPLNPINTYGKTKYEGEKIIEQYSKYYDIDSLVLRFSNVYGNERDILDRVIPRFILLSMGGEDITINGGTQKFDFTYIDDTVNGIILAIEYIEKNRYDSTHIFDSFHMVTGIPTEILTLAKKIKEYTSSESKIIYMAPRDYDVNIFYGNPDKAYKKLGFHATFDIDTGLKRTIKALRRDHE